MIPDQKLTDHFSLYELTDTSHKEFLEENRQVSADQIQKLVQVARLGEIARSIIEAPIRVSSGYRCSALNTKVGSTYRSQHLLCEAMDAVPIGIEVGDAFRVLWKAVKAGTFKVGQLIYETDGRRGYGVDSWIHLSLGTPFRDQARCNQVLRMQDGQYTALV